MWGKVPPPFSKTDYTLLKLRKLMATERPEGRRTRTGFTIPEVESMFRTALSWRVTDRQLTVSWFPKFEPITRLTFLSQVFVYYTGILSLGKRKG
jgi:hypothetical protein